MGNYSHHPVDLQERAPQKYLGLESSQGEHGMTHKKGTGKLGYYRKF